MSQKLKVVYDREINVRLDKYLVDLKIQELFSRTFIEKLINEDRILVNSIPVKKSYILSGGEVIDINLPAPEVHEIIPQNIPLDVIYEDDDLAVINKAPGMIVHPGYGNPDSTLVNAIVYHFGANLSTGKELNRPGIVHRLDRGTSGLMIIAKNDLIQSQLSEMFARREVEKTYIAVTTGIPDPPVGSIETYLSRCTTNPRKICVSDQGRWSLTHYEVVKYYHYFSLAKVGLETGRMHQIRVHFAHINTPVLGDLLYNSPRFVYSIVQQNLKRKVHEFLTNHLARQALHAWKLKFTHPASQKEIELYSEFPQDLIHTFKWLDTHFSIDNVPTDITLEEMKKRA